MRVKLTVVQQQGDQKKLVPVDAPPLHLHVNDSVEFFVDGGTVSINLDPGHGFDRDSFHTGGPRLIARTVGQSVLRCRASVNGGPEIGWGNSGTDVIIEP
jgi:hypothetical protein